MIILLALISGMIITVMNIFNGHLSDYYGVYVSTVVIHFIGLCTFVVMMVIKKEKISFQKHIPLILYSGGVIGVLTVVFNVMTVGELGAALLTALGLLGQMIISLILEQQGWLGTIKKKLTLSKMMSLIVVMIGIGVMML
ncbi:DMT family transporter [Candidatus Stoquefichus massiliensis]|uniref:DMT family transporter n=1 Tax=Candidatus Stoquefichus massiliensis TaxID=1470350 RepID=UPI0004820E3F|nr:DMT family transporter [Candidatus Stoquefichus massiliensis]